ncbi:MAG: type III pantothenate kinase [Flavobacteriales bacterium]|nr:type III pantothenate kinase [Flavobacteriales bacterium]
MGSTDQPTIDLVVDIGNSRVKLALFQGPRVLRFARIDRLDADALQSFLGADRPTHIAAASVGVPVGPLLHVLSAHGPVVELTGASPAPLPNTYSTPSTLGVDRLANAAALHALFPGRPALAIDLGTCITYDLVLPGTGFVGGAISPGPRMRGQAMHRYSARLPLVEDPGRPALVGTDTLGGLASGIHHGVRFELAGMIGELGQQHTGLAVVLTGGAAPAFAAALKSGNFADPLLTLRGLHVLLAHHRLHPCDPGSGGAAADVGAGKR